MPDDGGPLFMRSGDKEVCRLTVRDVFAMAAIPALLQIGTQQSRIVTDARQPYHEPDQPYYFGEWEPVKENWKGVDSLALDAYLVADAMLKIREPTAKSPDPDSPLWEPEHKET